MILTLNFLQFVERLYTISCLVMFGSQRQLSAGAVSARILDYGSRYALLVGYFWFSIKVNLKNGSLEVRNHLGFKWFCILSRIVITIIFVYLGVNHALNNTNHNLGSHSWIRVICSLIGSLNIILLHSLWAQPLLRVVNDFLRLFKRVQALPGCHGTGFGGKRELTLLIFKLICLFFEIPYLIFRLIGSFQFLADLYLIITSSMIMHSCFVGFLSVGVLYDRVNLYVRHELRHQLRSLEQPCEENFSRRDIKSAEYRLDQCVAIYDEIQRVSTSFQKLIDLPLFLMLVILFVSLTICSYYILCCDYGSVGLRVLVVKMYCDLLLLTLSVHGASISSRVIQRLSLENYFVCENKAWHMRVSSH